MIVILFAHKFHRVNRNENLYFRFRQCWITFIDPRVDEYKKVTLNNRNKKMKPKWSKWNSSCERIITPRREKQISQCGENMSVAPHREPPALIAQMERTNFPVASFQKPASQPIERVINRRVLIWNDLGSDPLGMAFLNRTSDVCAL